MAIAKGLLSEDDYLLQEILFNPRHPGVQVANIRTELKNLLEIIEKKMRKVWRVRNLDPKDLREK